jgi:hypothetical protein
MSFDGPVRGIPGATIRGVDELPEHLPGGEPAGRHMQAKPGQLLLVVPGVGRFLVSGGITIDVAAEPGADPGLVALLLHGSARSALIHQRGELPLHAATLVPPGGDAAIAICGASGAGKSTLAAALSRRNWLLVADDTTRVTWSGIYAMAWPSCASIKLWRDASEAKGIDIATLHRVAADLDKYYLRVPARDEPVRLAAIAELAAGEPAPSLSPNAGEKMALLTRHTFRQAHIRPLGRTADYARLVAHVAGTCRIMQFHGSRERPVAELADAIEDFMR